jgi:hypothetical protein
MITVTSSNGVIDLTDDGKVVEVTRHRGCEDDLQGLEGATFDLGECDRFWKREHHLWNYDILDLGVTRADGSYEPADMAWRQDTIDNLRADGIDPFNREAKP